MKSRPWYKMYADDWNNDVNLSLCSLAAQGLWIKLCNIMHAEGDPYGHLLIDSRIPTIEELSLLVRRPIREVRSAYKELLSRGVAASTSDGVVFSRRMVRDEQFRLEARKHGKRGGNPTLKGPSYDEPITDVTGVDIYPPLDSISLDSEHLKSSFNKR